VNPSPRVLSDVLGASQKPFVVSGTVSLTPEIITQMNAKNTLLVVQCDPADAPSCVAKLEDSKKKFGDVDNILLSMSAGPALDAAKQAVYLALIKGGWTKDQIYAIAGNSAGTLGAQGNLTRLALAAAGRGL